MQKLWAFIRAQAGQRRTLAWSGLALTTLFVLVAIERDKYADVEAATAEFKARHTRQAQATRARVEDVFHQIHRGLRLISRLPGVRTINRHAESFNRDAQASAQEVYNNLAQSVAVSEVYIVPVNFDPDAIDPTTGKLQEPITTFDDLIVGRTADHPTLRTSRQEARLQQTTMVEEIEIHEYRLMKRQIALLKQRYSVESSISYVEYPAISGEEVITCDNTRFSPTNPNDDDRKGLVYSVPFYGNDGVMRGIVSAVILTAAIRDLIPDGTKAIVGVDNNYVVGSSNDGVWRAHISDIKRDSNSPALGFSTVLPLRIHDIQSKWLLWMSQPNSELLHSSAIVAARDKAFWRQVATLVVAVLIFVLTRQLISRHAVMAQRAAELEEHVEQRTIELSKAKAEADAANAAKGQFLANMSHEIRTPLGIMLGVSEALSSSKLNSEQTEHVNVFRSAGRTLLALVNSVLDLAAIEAGKLNFRKQPASLKQIVDDLSGMFDAEARAKGIQYHVDIDPPLADALVNVDEARLKQVLINLIGNAIKFTDKGRVRTTVRNLQENLEGAVLVEFAVADTGPGISEESQQRIFEAFEQAGSGDGLEHGGSGLGLAIANLLVRRMGGTIELDSAIGKGTTFTFVLRLDLVAQEVADHTSNGDVPEQAQPLQGLCVLLAEDNSVLRRLTSRTLERLGCRVSEVGDGAAAVSAFKHQEFDLILMDCRMPVLDGLDATRSIRRQEADRQAAPIPIIALTAHGFDHNKQACLAAGMTDFLSKPFTSRQIHDVLLDHARRTPKENQNG